MEAARTARVPVVETKLLQRGVWDANKLIRYQRDPPLYKCFVKLRTQNAILLYIELRQGFLSLP